MNAKTRLAFLALAVLPSPVRADSIAVTDFRELPNGLFYPIEGTISAAPRVWDLGPLTIASPTASILGGVFPFDVDPNGPDPTGTSRLGYTGENAPAVFNLSQPVAALGVTFSFISPRNDAILRVYDGQDATGNLVGSILSPVIPPPWSAENPTVDFVAVWATDVSIRSFTIDGPVPGQGASLTGYGISFTPLPEPSAALLAALALLVLAAKRRR